MRRLRLPRLRRRIPRPTLGPGLVLWVVVAAIAIVGTWLVANGPAGDFRTVSLTGYDRKDHAAVEELVADVVRSGNMLSIPSDEVRQAARQSPWIDDVAFRRRFPLKLEVVVLRARPVAIGVPAKGKSVLVSSRGLVLGPAGKGKSLPRIRLGSQSPAVGERIPRKARPAWRFVRAAEDTDVYPRLRGLRMRNKDLVGHLVEGPQVLVGTPEELRAKALSLNLVYSALSPEDRRAAAYVDITVPDRPAVGAPLAAAADLVADASDSAAAPDPADAASSPTVSDPAPDPAPAATPTPATASSPPANPTPAPDPTPPAADVAPAPAPAPDPAPGPISPALDGASAPPPP